MSSIERLWEDRLQEDVLIEDGVDILMAPGEGIAALDRQILQTSVALANTRLVLGNFGQELLLLIHRYDIFSNVLPVVYIWELLSLRIRILHHNFASCPILPLVLFSG